MKVNTEANPRLAAYYMVHGIPAVKVFRGREVVAQFVGARPPAKVARFFDAIAPPELEQLVTAGDEDSLRRALELDRRRADAAVALAAILHSRGDDGAALEVLGPAGGSFAADALAARIRLDSAPGLDLEDALAALDAGDSRRAIDLLLGTLAAAPDHHADLRQLIVSELDRLGFGHPIAAELRRRLETAPARP